MDLASITPLVLTYNEEPNIRRCLERLTWATRVVVIDSGSTDATLAICGEFPNVEVIHREFDSFGNQCNHGLGQIQTPWVLSIDADYILPTGFSEVIGSLGTAAEGYRVSFQYCVFGKPLRACLYPPRTILYRPDKARYQDDGHGHRVQVAGQVLPLATPIDHDDRKSLTRWLASQAKYATLEAAKLEAETEVHGWPDRLRKWIWPAAPAAFVYTLVVKGVILDGWPGLYYALQRTYAELLLSLILLDRLLRSKSCKRHVKG